MALSTNLVKSLLRASRLPALIFLLPPGLLATSPGTPRAPALVDPLLGAPFPPRPRASIGTATAPVIVIEFSNFSCPHCLKFHQEVFPSLKTRYVDSGRILWIVINSSNSPGDKEAPSFLVARCALNEGLYWKTSDALYDFPGKKNATVDDFLSIYPAPERLKIESCVLNKAEQPSVDQDFDDYAALKIRGTPTFLLRKKRADGTLLETRIEDLQPAKYYQQVIDQFLAAP